MAAAAAEGAGFGTVTGQTGHAAFDPTPAVLRDPNHWNSETNGEKSGSNTPFRSGDTTNVPTRDPSVNQAGDDSSAPDESHQHTEKVPSTAGTLGRIVGGKFRDEMQQDEHQMKAVRNRPVVEVEFDLPLTYTRRFMTQEGREVILLTFSPDDKENPFNWPRGKKFFLTAQLCLMTLFIGLATTAYSSHIGSMTEHFGVSNIMGQLGLFLFNFVCALAPMVLAPLCELIGRKVVYVGAYGCFILCFIGLALGQNIETILVMRAFLGLFGCVGTILVGGTFSDMYLPASRSRSMALFSYIAILGTVGAPIYAGFIDMTIGWRWVEGIQGLSNLPLFAVILFFFTETRGGVYMKKRAKLIRSKLSDERYISEVELEAGDIKSMLNASSVKAVKMLVTEPVVFAFGLWISFAWFLTFLFLSVIAITFEEKRGWNHGVAGLPYISLCIGVTIGYVLNLFQIRKYEHITKSSGRAPTPEDRLYGAMWGAVFLPIGLFIYTFTQYAYLTWVGPAIALAPIACGIFFIFESCYSYTADCYGENSSSAIAGQGLMRNTLGAVSPLFANAFFKNLGSNYAGLLLSLVACLLTLIPFVMFKFGPALRARSKLAEQGKEKEEVEEEYRRPSTTRQWSNYRGSF